MDYIQQYRTDQDFHQQLLRATPTGIRLVQSFGDEMFRRIWWDNCAPTPTDHPRKRSPINQIHVDQVIDTQKPHVVIAFGEMAKESMLNSVALIDKKIKVMFFHHPNARFRTQAELDQFAQEVWDYVLVHDRKDEFTKHDK